MTTLKTIEVLIRIRADAPSDFDPRKLEATVKLFVGGKPSQESTVYLTDVEKIESRSL